MPRRGGVLPAIAISAALLAGPTAALAQSPLDPRGPRGLFPETPNFGRAPGSLDTSAFTSPGQLVIGGRRRSVLPKQAGTAHRTSAPAPASTLGGPAGMNLPTRAASESNSGSTSLPETTESGTQIEDEGTPDGLTLDAAIDRTLAANLDLRGLREELPQAEADVLTAGLRANPLLYADTQFIPYGANNAGHRPIGPMQYDVAITLPLDVSGKRRARVRVACEARRVVQAQYQDAVRRQIGNVARAFVDLQSARVIYLGTRNAVREQERIRASREKNFAARHKSDGDRLVVELEKTRAALDDAANALNDVREALGLLMNLPPEDAAMLEPRGRLRVETPAPPPLDELIRIGLRYRPDLAATRLGIGRADAEVGLARANRLDDVFLWYDPLTYQDNRPAHLPSGRSWDVALTVPLPIYNRNQGNIACARVNAGQTRLELAALERRVISEIRLAEREFRASRDTLARLERTTLPAARAARAKANARFLAGTIDTDEYLGQLNDEQETAGLYRETVVRHRKSMLDLNTAVGVRLLP